MGRDVQKVGWNESIRGKKSAEIRDIEKEKKGETNRIVH